jgi:probable phosphoglycerate mutase
MRLYWIRHGQMEIRASARLDVRAINRFFNQEEQAGLSARGRAEAERVAARLAREKIDAIYASPLLRAHETALVSSVALGLPIQTAAAISELRTGHLPEESAAAAWVRAMMRAPGRPGVKRAVLGGTLIPLYFHAWRTGKTTGGETPAELRERVRSFYAALEAEHEPDARVALFAHGYLIFTLCRELAKSRLHRLALWRRAYIPNGAITEMTLERGELELVRYADAGHLR